MVDRGICRRIDIAQMGGCWMHPATKYACRRFQANVSIGALPPMVIDKGIAGEGPLAHIITNKYADHLPLNRLEGILQRHGVDINVSTMCDWVRDCADLLKPLVKQMREKILEAPRSTLTTRRCRSRAGTARGPLITAICGYK